MKNEALKSARALLDDARIMCEGKPVGLAAAKDPESLAAENYAECFVRDFFPCALVSLNDGKPDIVRNFLTALLQLRTQNKCVSGHEIQSGVMPASFRKVVDGEGKESLLADFGERAIGKVAPVDSMMWWTLLLGIYQKSVGNRQITDTREFQDGARKVLEIYLQDTFEVYPTVLVPDGAFMIDRRMGVYGHPLEVQSLFFGALETASQLLKPEPENRKILATALTRKKALRSYVRRYYWLDLPRLSEIHRFDTEEFGAGSGNTLNIYPESIPDWLDPWLPENAGYMVGNLGPGRMDFRFFAQGNLLAILFGLTTDDQARKIMDLYERRWENLVGAMPVKICYPAVEGVHWKITTGCDSKNIPWSYHNGGNWPVLLWPFVAAALKTGRRKLAERAFDVACGKLFKDGWPEYYDGHTGRLIGRRANLNQTWSAAALVLSSQMLEDEKILGLFPEGSSEA